MNVEDADIVYAERDADPERFRDYGKVLFSSPIEDLRLTHSIDPSRQFDAAYTDAHTREASRRASRQQSRRTNTQQSRSEAVEEEEREGSISSSS